MKTVYLTKPVPVVAIEYDGTNMDECLQFPGIGITEDNIQERILTVVENGISREISPGSVLYMDGAQILHIVSYTEFHDNFTEHLEKLVDFGTAIKMMTEGKKFTRKAWEPGTSVELIETDFMGYVLTINDGATRQPFSPSVEGMLADDWVEVQGAMF